MVEDLMQALGFETYEDGDDGIFDRLADLIDPTCHNPKASDGCFCCPECLFPYETGPHAGIASSIAHDAEARAVRGGED